MKKRFNFAFMLLIASIIGMLLISGCNKGKEDTKSTVINPFISGSRGVVASFETMLGIVTGEGEEIYEGDSFPIQVLIKNKGGYIIPENGLVVKLKGIPLNDFNGIVSEGYVLNSAEIEGISDLNPDGDEYIIDFKSGTNELTYKVDITGSRYTINFIADVRYDYQTNVIAPNICFKEDIRDDSVCSVEGIKKVFSSAAPIQVTSVTQNRAGAGKIVVEFTIENKGVGSVAKPGTEFNYLRDSAVFEIIPEEEATKWECSPSEIIFDAGKRVVRCKLKDSLSEGEIYTKPINAVIKYQYQESISKSLTIRTTD